MATPHVVPRALAASEDSRIALFVPDSADTLAPPTDAPGVESEFEIGHVLFIDIVGYSKLLLDQQSEQQRLLNEIVRAARSFRRAQSDGKLILLPTGDGMALVFRSSPEAPAQCALEISEALRSQPQLQIRMGIHSGPVNHISDVNDRANVAGAGINIAQRVMDCGDAGHILISKHVAEDLEHSARWQPHLHDLGNYEVKHGVLVALVNLFTSELGNSAIPSRFAQAQRHARQSAAKAARRPNLRFLLVAIGALAVGSAWLVQKYYTDYNRLPDASILPSSPAHASWSAPEKSIAVLPFENLSTNQETAFFTDGVQDEILTNLAKVAELKVTSRTSVMQYRNLARRNLREIGKQLGVAHILEGSVQRIGNRIRINAQCIDARTDAHIWAQTYDRDLADVFAIQSEIAHTIAEQLQAKLSPKEEAEIDQKPTSDLQAYDLYLRAMQINRTRASSIGSGGAAEAKREAKLLEEAIARDPAFVPALSQLTQTHLYLYWVNADDPQVHLLAAKHALETAERLLPNAPGVHMGRALLYYWGSRDYARALVELALASKVMPNNTQAIFIAAMIERRQGHWQESTRHIEGNYALDPFNITIISELAGVNYPALRRYQDAIQVLDKARAWRPKDFALGALRANIDLAWKADLHPWQELLSTGIDAATNPGELLTARIDLALRERDYTRADHLLGEAGGSEFDDNGFFTPREWKQAIAARGLQDNPKAIALLEKARERAAAAVQARPEEARGLMVLAQIEAALGRKESAVRDGEHAVELLPTEKDAITGPVLLARLAGIYAQLSESGRALNLLERAVAQPYGTSYGALKLEEVWDPLRGDPRFQRLVSSISPR